MILTRQELTAKGHQKFSEDVIFNPEEYSNNPILISVDRLKAEVESDYVSDLVIVKIRLRGELTLRSTRSLKPVRYPLDVADETVYCFSDPGLEDDNIVLLKEEELNLTPIFYSLMIASLPLKVLAEDEEDHLSGEHWEVITEEEYLRRKSRDGEDSPFAALQDLDLE